LRIVLLLLGSRWWQLPWLVVDALVWLSGSWLLAVESSGGAGRRLALNRHSASFGHC
jgi:hypothetical protein